MGDFPGGTVDKNLPANAGDMGSVPGPERFHTLQNNRPWQPQVLSLHPATTEARAPRAHALQQEKTQQWEAPAQQPESTPTRHNEGPHDSQNETNNYF